MPDISISAKPAATPNQSASTTRALPARPSANKRSSQKNSKKTSRKKSSKSNKSAPASDPALRASATSNGSNNGDGNPSSAKDSEHISNYAASQARREELCRGGGLADSTQEKYDTIIKNARKWLEAKVKQEEAWQKGREGVGFDQEEDDMSAGGLGGDEPTKMPEGYSEAFTGDPKEFTPEAIATLMTEECCGEKDLGKSTAQAIHAAFRNFYNQLHGDKFRGRFRKEGDSWVGNPVDSAQVDDAFRVCSRKDGEHDRRHARSLHANELETIIKYLEAICPQECDVKDNKTLYERALCLELIAMFTLAWTIWMRVGEIQELCIEHLTMNPGHLESEWTRGQASRSYCSVSLRNRKGWESREAKGDQQLWGHLYHIPANFCPERPSINPDTHLRTWLDFYQRCLLRREFQGDDRVFPILNTSGNPFPKQGMSSASVSKHLNSCAADAGVKGAPYSTHSFRRGGAQYWFMYAPMSERWSMDAIRWWGGWAKGDNRDTLIRYLLDELYTYERSFSDVLFSVGQNRNRYAQLDTDLHRRLPTAAEHLEAFDTAGREMKNLHTLVEKSYAQVLSETRATSQMVLKLGQLGAASLASQGPPPSQAPPSWQDAAQHLPCPPPVQSIPWTGPPATYSPYYNPPLPASHISPHPSSQFPPAGPSHQHHQPSQYYTQAAPIQPFQYLSGASIQELPGGHQSSRNRRTFATSEEYLERRTQHIVPPITKGMGARAYVQAVRDWEFPDPSRNHHVALKDWEKEWITNSTPVLYHQRKVIALEFIEEYKRDGVKFQLEYPEYTRGVGPLVTAITKKRIERGVVIARNRQRNIY